jgi:hypothetical protein
MRPPDGRASEALMGDLAEVASLSVVRLISPVPMALVMVLLSFARGRAKAWTFVAGWFFGGLAVMIAALAVTVRAPVGGSGGAMEAWAQVVFGGVFMTLAGWTGWRVVQRRGRVDPSLQDRWLVRVEGLNLAWIAGVGAGFGVLGGPKNMAMLLHVAVVAGGAERGWPMQVALVLAAAVISTLGVALPVVLAMLRPDKTDRLLQISKAWLLRHSGVILLIIFAIFGPLLLVRGLLQIVG